MKSRFYTYYYRIRYWFMFKEKMNAGTIFYFSSSKKSKETTDDEKYLDDISKSIVPNDKSVNELINYLKENYLLKEYTKDRRDFNRFYLNVIENSKVKNRPINSVKEQLQEIYNSKNNFEIFLSKLDEDLSKEVEKNQFKAYFYTINSKNSTDTVNKNATIDIETYSNSIYMSGLKSDIVNDITIYFGVSKIDILSRSRRFILYAHALRESKQV